MAMAINVGGAVVTVAARKLSTDWHLITPDGLQEVAAAYFVTGENRQILVIRSG
jgi:hypothetical protein